MINQNLTTDLNKSFDNITFVTVLFNIRDSKERGTNLSSSGGDRQLKRGYTDYYVKSLEMLCRKFKDMFVFCDKECADNLYAPNAKVIVMKLEDLPMYGKLERLKELFKNTAEGIKYRRNIHLHSVTSDKKYSD